MSRKNVINALLAISLTLTCINSAYSVAGFQEWRTRTGIVMARGLVYTEDGFRIFTEYDEQGNIVSANEVIEDDSMQGAFVISGSEYRAIVNYYNQFQSENANGIARGARVMTREEYENENFLTFDNKPLANGAKSPLLTKTKSVLVRNQKQIFLTNTDPLLFQASFSLEVEDIEDAIVNNNDIKSVLIDPLGNVRHFSENNIGYKVLFFENESDENYKPGPNDKIYDPLDFVPLYMPDGLVGGSTATGNDGRYSSLYMLPPCPGFSYELYTPITLRLYYKNFNPRIERGMGLYHLTKPGYDFCSGLSALPPSPSLLGVAAHWEVMAIEASMAQSIYQTHFMVDTAVIGGEGFFSNENTNQESTGSETPIPLGEETQYKYERPDLSLHADYHFDFDGDGGNDLAVLGDLSDEMIDGKEVAYFERNNIGPYQGIYLSGGTQNPNSDDRDTRQPDFVRLADKMPDFTHQGLLETISEEDFKKTDILVFRESNGKLITQRNGLDEGEFRTRSYTYLDGNAGEMAYSIMVRGPKSAPFDYADRANRSGTDWYSGWQSAAGMDESLHQRKADHIRPQEKIRVIAINRKTGYMGSVRTTYGKFITDGYISMNIDKIVMRPPNLKVIVERKYDIEQGLTQGEEREYLIGYEGAALDTDKTITITTEWFDHDGSPLPEELDDYGFTGRLAKVVSENTVQQDSSAIAHFKIKPGRHTENIQLSRNIEHNIHYYVQVSAKTAAETADFNTNPESNNSGENSEDSTDGSSDESQPPPEPLDYRPQFYVPIKAPIMDEAMTIEQWRAYRDYVRNNPEGQNNPQTRIEKPEPIYRWFYRPELQFSLFGLRVNEILRVNYNEDGSEQTLDILNSLAPSILPSDDLVRLVYTLTEDNFAALPFLGPGQELVFSLGPNEIDAVTARWEDGQFIFTNLDAINDLDIEDFLTISLYSNNDAGNILWEYAFGGGLIINSSDDPGSRAAKSFIICNENAQGRSICEEQQAITAHLALDLPDDAVIEWNVEALRGNTRKDDLDNSSNSTNKLHMYGETKNWKVGANQAVNNAVRKENTDGTGRYQSPWTSENYNYSDARYFSFSPDLTGDDYTHLPSNYNRPDDCVSQYDNCLSGTNMTDVWRHNPHVGYKISVIVNGQTPLSKIVKMDHVDVLRQEYIDLMYSTRNDSLTAQAKGVRLLERDNLVAKNVLPTGDWVDSDYEYSHVVDDGMVRLARDVMNGFETYRQLEFNGLANATFQVSSNSLKINSSYRNPERNERIGTVSGSRHMMGRAVDFGFSGLTALANDASIIEQLAAYNNRGILFGSLWQMISEHHADWLETASLAQLEGRGGPSDIQVRTSPTGIFNQQISTVPLGIQDADNDDIPDEYELTFHLHIQDNPSQ
ncbi:D-Ala-D-Ala carboxypeptidase family metallohydrolase [Pleionea sediminis]|uniref:D-Ala-D-Ala carboxypeptidase family metallohydrolase n=1 Tax=Pleionea sediminis TaxID=2569479 RepID=UPI001186A182|nr:D-Ala-D-Ala carboxypeptidase family metallohydrolase [Pleionea sediminis]